MIQPQSLQYFAEVARTGSLRHASDAFFVAPSAISRQIANLERELGAPLFERSSRGMALTEAGRILLDFVQDNNHRVDRVRAAIDDLADLRRGLVRIAVVEAATTSFLPGLYQRFAQQHPGIRFRVAVRGTHQIADLVAADSAEIGMAFNALSRDDLVIQARIRQPLQLITRPGHPLAGRPSIAITDLEGVRVALPDRSFGIRYLIDNAVTRAGCALEVVFEADSLELLKSIVRCTDTVTFMPAMTFGRETASGELVSIPLADPPSEQGSIDIITARDRKLPVAAQAFLNLLVDELRR